MSNILIERGRHSLHNIKKIVNANFSVLLEQKNIRVIQRLELFDYLEYILITNDLTKNDIELIISKKKFSGFIPGKKHPIFIKEKKECVCDSVDYFRQVCTCGARE